MSYAALIVALAVAGTYALATYLRRRERDTIANRRHLSDEQIYDLYYGDSNLDKESIKVLWHEISGSLKLPPGQLRPTDEFGRTFARNWLTNDVLEALEQKAVDHASKMDRSIDLTRIRTIDDYIRTFATHR